MENWKVIEKTDNKYEISDLGRCRNIEKGTFLKENRSTKYSRYFICGKFEYIHRLVAFSFMEKTSLSHTVSHISEDFYDNRLENLKWTTYNGDKKVGMYKDGKLLMKFNSCKSAGAFFKKPHNLISLCINGKRKTGYGYVWKLI